MRKHGYCCLTQESPGFSRGEYVNLDDKIKWRYRDTYPKNFICSIGTLDITSFVGGDECIMVEQGSKKIISHRDDYPKEYAVKIWNLLNEKFKEEIKAKEEYEKNRYKVINEKYKKIAKDEEEKRKTITPEDILDVNNQILERFKQPCTQ